MMPTTPTGAGEKHGTQAIESTPLLKDGHLRTGSAQSERLDQDGEVTRYLVI